MSEIVIPAPERLAHECCEHVAAGRPIAGRKLIATGEQSGHEAVVCAECLRGSEYLVLAR